MPSDNIITAESQRQSSELNEEMGFYAFLLKHNSLLLPFLPLSLVHVPCPFSLFSLFHTHSHYNNNYLFLYLLQYTVFNFHLSFRYVFLVLSPFFNPPSPPQFPHSPLKLQGQTGQTMPLVSAQIANTIGDHHLGLLGNGLTINFQLKQTKEMTAQALWKMSRICINIRQVSIIVSSPLHQ